LRFASTGVSARDARARLRRDEIGWSRCVILFAGHQTAIGAEYRRVIGKHVPTMPVIGEPELLEPADLMEIEATAVPRAG
jgi:hypothetical protein